MHDRQGRLLAVLATLLAIGLLVLRLDRPGDSAPAPPLLDLASRDVVRLELRHGQERMIAERTEAGWVLTAPVAARGDDAALDDLAALPSRLHAARPVAPRAGEAGLDAPRAVLVLATRSGEEHVLELGDPAPMGAGAYARLDGGPVRLLDRDPGPTLVRPPAFFRDGRVASIPTSAVTSVAFALDGRRWRVTRRPDGWFLDDGRRVRRSAVEGLLAALDRARLETFVDDPGDPGEPRGEFAWTTPEGTGRLEVFGPRSGGDLVRTPSGVTGTVGDAAAFFPAPEDLLEDRLVPLPPGEVEAIRLHLDGRSGAARREGGAWAPAAAEEAAARLLLEGSVDRAAGCPPGAATAGRLEATAGEVRLVVDLLRGPGGDLCGREGPEAPPFSIPPETAGRLEALLDAVGG